MIRILGIANGDVPCYTFTKAESTKDAQSASKFRLAVGAFLFDSGRWDRKVKPNLLWCQRDTVDDSVLCIRHGLILRRI